MRMLTCSCVPPAMLGSMLLPAMSTWWVKTDTTPVRGQRGLTCAWLGGGNGQRLALLGLPWGRGRGAGLARFRAILAIGPQGTT